MIDWGRVAELRSEIGIAGFAEVATMFLEEADATVQTLAPGLTAAELESLLHFLKGSALNLGLADVAALCQDGERRASAGRASEVDTAALGALYRRSRQALLEGLAAATAPTESAA